MHKFMPFVLLFAFVIAAQTAPLLVLDTVRIEADKSFLMDAVQIEAEEATQLSMDSVRIEGEHSFVMRDDSTWDISDIESTNLAHCELSRLYAELRSAESDKKAYILSQIKVQYQILALSR